MLRVISYNIRVDSPPTGPHAWSRRKAGVAALLRRYEPALTGVQEALPHQLDDLVAALPGTGAFGVGRDDGAGGGELNPILFQTARLRLRQQGTFWLSRTPDVPGSSSWGAGCRRIVTWGEFVEVATGTHFFLFNTHLDHQSALAREEGARLLKARMAAIAGQQPVVVTGDFNDVAGSPMFRLLTEPDGGDIVLQDAQQVAEVGHEGPAGTFNLDFAAPVGEKIDYIFVSPDVAVRRHAILDDAGGGRYPSDHLPVLADVRLPD
jgi:endonuclease/exonuclease/phosphatase family metal-dependent hydrolase